MPFISVSTLIDIHDVSMILYLYIILNKFVNYVLLYLALAEQKLPISFFTSNS